jgi:hypothetical protein
MSSDRHSLSLPEELLLLVLRDREGTIAAAWWRQALAGAILGELILSGRIASDPDKKALVGVVKNGSLHHAVLDECLDKIRTTRRRTNLAGWVKYFANLRKLHHRVAEALCRLGVLHADESKLLGIFKRKVYPEVDPGPEREIVERLRKAIFSDNKNIEPRTRILLSLAHGARLLTLPFKKQDLKRVKPRIAQLIEGEPVGMATADAVRWQEIQTVLICTMAASSS